MEREVPAGRHVAQCSVSRHIVGSMGNIKLGVGNVHVERREVDRKHVNNNNDNSDDNSNNIHDNANSTTSHAQRLMAVTGKELPGGRDPYEPVK